jgi:squalene-hopene/tetraprenyl-beta-curcumene cyclase
MRGGNRGSAIIATLATAALLFPQTVDAGDQPAWDARAAASYLDARAAAWLAYPPAHRGEGADQVSCLSCHTSLPYALARPALRRAAGEDQPTAYEERLLANVRHRVAHWNELGTPRFPVYYGENPLRPRHEIDEKSVESRGTEAVLNALVLAFDDRRRGLQTPGDSTRAALRHLWATQRSDGPEQGSWNWLEFGNQPWEAGPHRSYFGATLAALAVGTAPGYLAIEDDPASRQGLERLRRYIQARADGQNLHNLIWTLWASTSFDGLLTASEQRRIIDAVVAKQQPSGGWGLASLIDCHRRDGTPQDFAPDGYATGLAVAALQRAERSDDHHSVARGREWLRTNQQATGAWAAHSLNKHRDPGTHTGKFMSDAATAFAVFALEIP